MTPIDLLFLARCLITDRFMATRPQSTSGSGGNDSCMHSKRSDRSQFIAGTVLCGACIDLCEVVERSACSTRTSRFHGLAAPSASGVFGRPLSNRVLEAHGFNCHQEVSLRAIKY